MNLTNINISEILNGKLGKKILFSLFIIFIVRVLSQIPLIGISSGAISKLYQGTTFGETVGVMSGNLLQTASIITLGIGPYITSSIIVQLTGIIYPRFNEAIGDDLDGKRIKGSIVRFITLIMSLLNGYIIYKSLSSIGLVTSLSTFDLIVSIILMTFGSLLIMYMAELTSEMGVGQGSGLIITTGIISSIPYSIVYNLNHVGIGLTILGIIVNVLIVFGAVYLYQGFKKVGIMLKNRRILKGPDAPYIPVKPLGFGAMPVIISSTLIGLPVVISQYILINESVNPILFNLASIFSNFMNNPIVFIIIQFVGIVYFSLVYEKMAFRATDIANTLNKAGQYVPGIRPGNETNKLFKNLSERMAFLGGIYLGTLVSIATILVSAGITPRPILSGTGTIILIGSILEFKKQIDAEIGTYNTKRF